jgi:hypothetical protein
MCDYQIRLLNQQHHFITDTVSTPTNTKGRKNTCLVVVAALVSAASHVHLILHLLQQATGTALPVSRVVRGAEARRLLVSRTIRIAAIAKKHILILSLRCHKRELDEPYDWSWEPYDWSWPPLEPKVESSLRRPEPYESPPRPPVFPEPYESLPVP